jgi:PAS domain S-box-containing protein
MEFDLKRSLTQTSKPSAITNKHQYFITIFTLILTLLLSNYTYKQNLQKRQEQFKLVSQQIVLLINDRMDYYTQLLLGGVGLMVGSNEVTREDWKSFSRVQHLDSKFLGIQGIGYAEVIQPYELTKHIEKIRKEGFEHYTVKPMGIRSLYTSIVYLEPFNKRNQRAFGYDMFSQETRHAAMQTAIDTGTPSLSGKVRLLQENGTDEQAGFLLYVPVYKKNMPLDTDKQKLEAIQGFVYAAFRAKNLFINIAGSMTKSIGVEIYDGDKIDAESLLLQSFDSDLLTNSSIQIEDTLHIANHTWKLRFSALNFHYNDINQTTPWIILAIGTLFSSLLFLFFRNIVKMEEKQKNYIDELQSVSLKKTLALKAGIIGIWEWNFNNQTLIWDQHMYQIYGKVEDSKENPYSLWGDAVDLKDKPLAEEALQKAIETNTEYNHKFWIITPSGERKYIHAIGLNELDSEGNALRMVGTNIDITEQKLLEMKLSNEQEALLQVKTTGFIHLHRTHLMWTNAAFEEMFGYEQGELQGQEIKKICKDQSSSLYSEKQLSDALSSSGTFSGEVAGVKKDGTFITILVTITKLKDTKNEAMGVIMDITRQKELEQNLHDEVEKKTQENFKQFQILQQQSKLASMGEMIGAIAHQWRQPLNELSIRIQKIKYKYASDKIDEEYINDFTQKSKNTINFMSKTIDDFRNFFRIDKEKSIFETQVAIEEVLNIQNAQLKHHDIEVTLKGESFEYEGYKTEFQQVIINIISNAKDAFISNKTREPKLLISLNKHQICISDNAGGVPSELINRVFEPYFTTKEQGEGTGMGLYMSKMIIEDNMNGKLTLENKNDGVEACITLL